MASWNPVIDFFRQTTQGSLNNSTGLISVAIIIGVLTVMLWNGFQPHRALANMAGATPDSRSNVDDAPPIPPPSEIISLRVYPIKSCRGFEVSTSHLHTAGLTLDRNWMFVSRSDRQFLTIRSDPSMTLIDTKLITSPETQETQLEISIHNTDGRIVIPAFPSHAWLESHTTLSTVEIWEQNTDAWEYPAETNRIFCEFFNKDVALVYKGPTPRNVGVNGRAELYGKEVAHHFADVMSLQVASEASIKDLNKRLGHAPGSPEALTIERFRPNIIIRGRDDHPWEEDTWKRIRITNPPSATNASSSPTSIDLDVVARCPRCQVPNVNPATAEKDPKQPWDTMMKFRRVDQGSVAKWKPCFGMLAVPLSEGKVRVGARLECLETTNKHLFNVRGFREL